MEYTFDMLRKDGMKADTKTFCCLINGYANVGLFHKVISIVQMAEKFDIRENTAFYNAVIYACARADDLMEMDRVFKRMKDKQCLPDSRTYSIMIEAYKKEGMNDRVYDLEQEKQNEMLTNTCADTGFETGSFSMSSVMTSSVHGLSGRGQKGPPAEEGEIGVQEVPTGHEAAKSVELNGEINVLVNNIATSCCGDANGVAVSATYDYYRCCCVLSFGNCCYRLWNLPKAENGLHAIDKSN
ncbi:hypothetical protein ACFE04_015040 [Oxalis oulophora]